MAVSPDPEPCKDQDLGLFEVTKRDGAARIGRFHTKHGSFTTPALLPVVNPNILTIEPREMWEDFGIEALITNSYVIWKNDDLRERALSEGIHSLLDFPGAIVTDSGTFQSYVYGDVEVNPREIVAFQRDMGVDVGTMLDVFGRPDMNLEQLEGAVRETSDRAQMSLEEAGDDLLLNGPIQGGLYPELRMLAAHEMASARGSDRGFAIHPIGGIVPLMEQQRYRELFMIMLASRSALPPNRPTHLFGCGHPLLFPMAIALGADLFDSAAYAIFARDGRILTPEGTVKLEGIREWPFLSNSLSGYTPEQVKSMDDKERCRILAQHNLEVTQAELSRCREAIRNGTIWQLAEQRSHCSPQLRDAFVWLQDQLDEPDDGPVGESVLRIIASCNPLRDGGEPLGDDIEFRPHILHMQALLATRWRVPGSWWDSSTQEPKQIVLLEGASPPWRYTALDTIISQLEYEPRSVVMIATPLGPIPFSLEDLSPWCHLTGPGDMWMGEYSDEEIQEALSEFGLADIPILRVSPEEGIEVEEKTTSTIRNWLDRCSIVDKLSVLCAIHPLNSCKFTDGMSTRRSRTDRVINVLSEGVHVLSPRLSDGGLSLSLEGARRLNDFHLTPPPKFGEETPDEVFGGIPRILISDDAIPFVGIGRNVVHGYSLGVDHHLIPGQPCLIVDKEGSLVAHGTSLSTSLDIQFKRKGIAVKVRDGALKESK
ncbi:MAG TPA: tRNA guanosine(15) transglycosylase TgtA [Candidatus Thalassarchaeaceae archaeon]|nr:tRNA guanosine(15) transglycosylase TgtA [Candidatus Thalassarchaeaceae archaeon]